MSSCIDNYYIDYKDGKCKSNKEDNKFKYCRIADEVCVQCEMKYELGEDNKCTDTKNCAESENGKCISCSDNYYLGLDNQCTNIKHYIYSIDYNCIECENNYYYDEDSKKCVKWEDNFKNCKLVKNDICKICKKDYYLNQADNSSYGNKKEDEFYKCEKTDLKAEICIQCIDGYYLGDKDKRCSRVEECILSEDENKCLECDFYYCLDIKTGKCISNYEIEDEEKKFYFRCNETNKEGNACQLCEEDYILDENGLCYDEKNCVYLVDEKCKTCKYEENGYYCLNRDFGCIEIYYDNHCLECNNILDFDICTKCLKKYDLIDGKCIKSE